MKINMKKQQKGKKYLWLISLAVIMAVIYLVSTQQSSVQENDIQRLEQEQNIQGKTNQEFAIEELPGVEIAPAEKKQTKEECVQQLRPLMQEKNEVFRIEQEKVQITFVETASYADALDILEKYGLQQEKIVDIFGELLKEKKSEEEQFLAMRTIIAKSAENIDEVQTACMIQQEAKVKNAMLVMIFDLGKKSQ